MSLTYFFENQVVWLQCFCKRPTPPFLANLCPLRALWQRLCSEQVLLDDAQAYMHRQTPFSQDPTFLQFIPLSGWEKRLSPD